MEWLLGYEEVNEDANFWKAKANATRNQLQMLRNDLTHILIQFDKVLESPIDDNGTKPNQEYKPPFRSIVGDDGVIRMPKQRPPEWGESLNATRNRVEVFFQH